MSDSAPAARFSRLSLERMPPTTRSQSQQRPTEDDPPRGSDHSSGSEGDESDASMEEEDDENTSTIIRSPVTNITYDISSLDPTTQDEVRGIFSETPASPPPRLQYCQTVPDGQGNQVYAFRLNEPVPRSIRISSSTGSYPRPACDACGRDSRNPCRHLIFLLDQINYHTSGPQMHLSDSPICAVNMENPFDKISAYHLDLLAASLRCDVGPPDSNVYISPVHLREVQDIIATVAGKGGSESRIRAHRSDIFNDPGLILKGNGIIAYGDLERTVTNMLLTNGELFAHFLKLLEPMSEARDPFRRIRLHVDHVLAELDSYAQMANSQTSSAAAAAATARPGEGPCDVPWAAGHIVRAVKTIDSLLQNRADTPSQAEKASAARALVTILKTVVMKWNRDIHPGSQLRRLPSSVPPTATTQTLSPIQAQNDRNLYQRLIGNVRGDAAFVVVEFNPLVEEADWVDELELIENRVISYGGAPDNFVSAIQDLISRMQASKSGEGAAAVASRSGHRRVEIGGSASASAMSASTSMYESSRRGSVAGSKRSVGGNGGDGAAKRVR